MANVTPPGEGPPPLGYAVDRAILDACYQHAKLYSVLIPSPEIRLIRRRRDGRVVPLANFLNKAGPTGPASSRQEVMRQDAERGTPPRVVPGRPGRAGRVVELD